MGLCPECLIKSGFPTGVDTETESGARQKFVPPTVEEVAKIFPQLEILEFLGNGGMERCTRRGRSNSIDWWR